MNTIRKNGTRVTVELDEQDCAVITSALKLAATTRDVGRKAVTKIMSHANQKTVDALGSIAGRFTKESPAEDKRHADLIELFASASHHH